MIGTLELAKVLHEARREPIQANHFRFFEFENLSQLDREVLYAQAVAVLDNFIITPKTGVLE